MDYLHIECCKETVIGILSWFKLQRLLNVTVKHILETTFYEVPLLIHGCEMSCHEFSINGQPLKIDTVYLE